MISAKLQIGLIKELHEYLLRRKEGTLEIAALNAINRMRALGKINVAKPGIKLSEALQLVNKINIESD